MSRLSDITGTIKTLFWIGRDSKITATATQDRVYTLPDKSGTFSMLDDVGGGGGGGGVTDHGALTGLADDDHSQYHNNARGDARYSQLGHTHTASNVTDFNSASRGQVEAMLVAGSNVTLTPAGSGASRTITIASTGGGGGGGTSYFPGGW